MKPNPRWQEELKVVFSNKHSILILASLGVLGGVTAVNADDFIVAADGTATNGGATVNGSDTLVVNSGVTLDHSGQPVGPAIETTGGNNTVTNNGTVIGDGGIDARAVVMNGASSTFINTGTVTTTTTSQSGSFAVETVGNGAVINNSGTISTSGDDAHAVVLGGSTTDVTNSGTIIATGANADAVRFNSSTESYTTSGRTISKQGAAVYFGAGENSLNLNAPAYVEGTLTLANSTFVTINTGQSHSFQWTFDGTPWNTLTINGSVPTVISGTTVASIDPTIFEAAPTGMIELSSQVADLLGARTETLLPDGVSVSTKLSPMPDDPPVTKARTFNRWTAVFGNVAGHAASGAKLGYGTAQAGVVAGIDWAPQADRVFGLMAGGAAGRFAVDAPFMRSHRIQTQAGFAGFYGARRLGLALFDFSLMGGIQNHNSQRSINNNIVVGGVDTGIASYGSKFIAPKLSLARSYAVGGNLILTTTASLGYVAGFVDGYTETATASTATFSARRFGIGTGIAKVKLARNFGATTVSGQLGLVAQNGFGGEALSGTLLGQAWAYTTDTGAKLAGHMAVEAQHRFGRQVFAQAKVETNIGSVGLANIMGSASLRIEF